MPSVKNIKRVVIKIGSNVLSGGTGLRKPFFTHLAAQIGFLHRRGIKAVIVSSGAIAAGMAALGLTRKPHPIPEKQALAALGQPLLMNTYARSFVRHKMRIAQILLTQSSLENRNHFLNARHAIQALLNKDIVPIINENDTVVVDEIKVGDNDQLSAHAANLVEADLLVILSDVDGLFDKNPAAHADAKLISRVGKIDEGILGMVYENHTVSSTGGMATKLRAAQIATGYGIPVFITSGFRRYFLRDLLLGKAVGTLFEPSLDPLAARKHWILNVLKPKGRIVVDAGARRALIENKKSLLPSGITLVDGVFEIGDCVAIHDDGDALIAKGLASYSRQELERIRGIKSSQIEKTLGYRYGDEAIHRDDLVLVGP